MIRVLLTSPITLSLLILSFILSAIPLNLSRRGALALLDAALRVAGVNLLGD